MSNEFDDAEMHPCDICGEFLPRETMYQLDDGSVICQDCFDRMQ